MKHVLKIGRSFFGRMLIITGLVLSLLVMNATVAFAKTQTASTSSQVAVASTSSCYSSPSEATCDNVDPEKSGCSTDAYTQTQAKAYDGDGHYNGYIQLRYSPHCGTNWGRYVSVDGNTYYVYTIGIYRCSVAAVNGACPSQTIDKALQVTVSAYISVGWTPMVYAPVKGAQAYVYVPNWLQYTIFV